MKQTGCSHTAHLHRYLAKFINKKTKCLNVAGVRAMNDEFIINKKFISNVLGHLISSYAKEGEVFVDRR